MTEKKFSLVTSRKVESSEVGNNCTVCLEKLQAGADVFETSCRHIFHAACISGWFKHNSEKTCPECRNPISEVVPQNVKKRKATPITTDEPTPTQEPTTTLESTTTQSSTSTQATTTTLAPTTAQTSKPANEPNPTNSLAPTTTVTECCDRMQRLRLPPE